jgi:hypothetical protein
MEGMRMKLRKLLLLGTVVCAVAVMAAPAMAQAFTFNDNGNPITGEVMETYNGEAAFENGAGGIRCEEVHFTVVFTAHDAHVTGFLPTGCATTGLLPTFGCELSGSPTAANLPWTVVPLSTEAANVENVFIHNPMGPGCAFGEDIYAESNGENEVHINAAGGNLDSVSLSGSLETPLGPVSVSGNLAGESKGTLTLTK